MTFVIFVEKENLYVHCTYKGENENQINDIFSVVPESFKNGVNFIISYKLQMGYLIILCLTVLSDS